MMRRICCALLTVKERPKSEQIYWQEKGKIEAEIDTLKREAAAAREIAAKRGEENLPRAITAITSSVNSE